MSQKLWSFFAKRYIASPISDVATYERKLKETQTRLKPHWSMVEIGCGSGKTALAHALHVASITAYDYTPEMIENGRLEAQEQNISNVTFLEAAFEDIPTSQTYDAVLMLNVLHLIPEWDAGIEKIAQLTKPGGIFVCSTFAIGSAALPLRALAKLSRVLPFIPTLSAFSEPMLVDALTRSGFEIELTWTPDDKGAFFVIARKPT